MKYVIEIEEMLSRKVVIDAESEQEAFQKVKGMYRMERIVLSADDYSSTTFKLEEQDNRK